MKSPITGKEMTLEKEHRIFVFRKQSIDIIYRYFLCSDSGEKFEDDRFSELNLLQVHNKYRELNYLPFKEEIVSIREKYQVSSARMSLILGFGPNTYRNYEFGEIPSASNAKLIQLIKDPKEFLRLIHLSNLKSENGYDKIVKRAEYLSKKSEINILEFILKSDKPNEYNGYRVLDIHKVFELICYFANHLVPWKTQLNKLLFYTDFTAFKETGYSITGLQYCAIPRGPVPDRYETIFEFAEIEGYTMRIEQELFNGKEGIRYQLNDTKTINLDIFSEEELSIMKHVITHYGKMTTSQIIKQSHLELGWIENEQQKSNISYDYGFYID